MLPTLGMVACLTALAGCGGGESEDVSGTLVPAVAPTHTPAPPTPEPEAVVFSDVIWATALDDNGEPGDEVNAYPADAPAIIAAVEVSQVSAGSVITATWQIDGEDVPDASVTVTSEEELEQGWATFQFVRDGDQIFPLGQLEVTIESSDGTMVTGEVDIVLP